MASKIHTGPEVLDERDGTVKRPSKPRAPRKAAPRKAAPVKRRR